MDEKIVRLRAIELELDGLEKKKADLIAEKRSILEIGGGAGKTKKKTLSDKDFAASLASIQRRNHERSKTI